MSLEGPDSDGTTFAETFSAEVTGGAASKDRGDYQYFMSKPSVVRVEMEFAEGSKRIKYV